MLYYPLSREPGRVSIWYPFHQRRNALPQTPASINAFHTGPLAVPQISCDVTHHSGVFTAYYASKRGSSHGLPFFPKHVWSSKDELFIRGGAPARVCHRWRPFQTCSTAKTNSQAERQIWRSTSPRVEEKLKTRPRSPIMHIHYASNPKPHGFVALAQQLHSQLQEKDYLLSPSQRDDGAAAQLKQHFPFS